MIVSLPARRYRPANFIGSRLRIEEREEQATEETDK